MCRSLFFACRACHPLFLLHYLSKIGIMAHRQKGLMYMKKSQQRSSLWLFALFTLTYLYFETLFRASALETFWNGSLGYMMLFALGWGLFGYFIATLIPRRTVSVVLTATQLLLTGVIFLVEYFTHRYFNVFYDVTTVIGGAGGVATDFMDVILGLVFSWDGLLKITLFLLPGLLYVFLLRRYAYCVKLGIGRQLVVLLLTLTVFLGNFAVLLGDSTYAPMYREEYNFQAAVSNFGLLTGMRLDVQQLLFGKEKESSFEIVDMPDFPTVPAPTQPTAPSETVPDATQETVIETKPIEYGYNVMDLNFPETGVEYIDSINAYVQSLTPSKQNAFTGLFAGKNLIFITAEAFTAEVIDPDLTPTLYRLANKGIQFTDYYQPDSAGTTGGEYQNLFGMLPTAGGMSLKNTANFNNYFTMGNQLNRLGYYGKAYHNHDYFFYDRHLTHINLGYSGGYTGFGNGLEKFVTKQWPESDLEMIQGTVDDYLDKQPFNIYYMTVSGHSDYSLYGNCMSAKNWEYVKDLPYSTEVKCYLAANLELEHAMTYLVQRLEEAGIADDTVIVIAADHYPYGISNNHTLAELYGFYYQNQLERDHNRLILWSGCLEDMDPIVVDTPTSSLDILPTLSNLFGTEYDSRLMPGRDVFSNTPALVYNVLYDWKTEYGTYLASTNTFTPVSDDIVLPEGYVEQIKAIVRNRIRYSAAVLNTDYMGRLFGQK